MSEVDVAAKPLRKPFALLADELSAAYNRHGLDWQQARVLLLAQMAASGRSAGVQAAVLSGAADVLNGEAPHQRSRAAMWLFAHETQRLLDTKLSRQALNEVQSRSSRTYRRISNSIVGLLFFVNIYLVIGCLLEGRSHIAHQPLVAVGLFICLLALLGAVEALHISVAVLRLKDLAGVRTTYPRTYALHEVFKSEEGAERFLAGRQFMVITIVFVIAQLTTFKGVTQWPGTSVNIPGAVEPIVSSFLLEFGMAGAFLALWFAQLAPQFAANRRPLLLMNSPPIGLLFKIALIAEFLGFTRPGGWLASRVSSDPDIPGSSEERYRQGIELTGIALTSIAKTWSLEKTQQSVAYSASAVIEAPKVRDVIDSGLMYSLRSPRNLQWSGEYLPPTTQTADDLVVALEEQQEAGEWNVHRVIVRPAYGQYFETDGIVSCQATLSGTPPEVGRFRDAFLISAPTKFVVFRAEFIESPSELSDIKLRILPVSPTADPVDTDELEVTTEETLQFKREGTLFVAECCVTYPPIGSYIEIDWTYRW